MSNDYFNANTTIARFSRGASAVVNGIFQSIASGFDLLPGRDALNQDRVTYLTGGGTANAITAGMTPALTSYEAGLNVKILLAATNTGAATLNIDGLGARSVVRPDGPALAGDLTAGDVADLIYNGTSFIIMGIPRAAAGVIESGSNANGAYVRFADRTQICWVRDFNMGSVIGAGTGTYAVPYRTDAVSNITWPASFSATPTVSHTLRLSESAVDPAARALLLQGAISPTTTQWTNLRAQRVTSDSTAGDALLSVIAIGRWF